MLAQEIDQLAEVFVALNQSVYATKHMHTVNEGPTDPVPFLFPRSCLHSENRSRDSTLISS